MATKFTFVLSFYEKGKLSSQPQQNHSTCVGLPELLAFEFDPCVLSF